MNIKKEDVVWTYLSKCLTLGMNIILLPLIMKFLSDDELGLWYVFVSISQVVNLFDFGFNPTLARHMTYAWSGANNLEKTSVGEYKRNGEKNVLLIAEVITTCKMVYLAISFAALFVMVTIGTMYVYKILNMQMTTEILYSWMIYIIAVFLNLLYGYWSSLLNGIGAIAERNRMSVYSKIIQLVLAFLLLLQGMGLLGFVISYAISGFALRLIGKYYFKKKTRRFNFHRSVEFEKIRKCFSTIWATAWKDGIVMIAQYLSTQANTLICAYFVDLNSTSSYGVITQIGSMMGALAASYYAAYQPQYSSLCLQRQNERLKKLTCKSIFAYKIFFVVIFIGFVFVGIPILKIIRPSMNLSISLIIAVSLFYYLYNQHSLFCSMIASSNRIPYYKSYIFTAIVSVLISIVLTDILKWGVWGLIIAQFMANIVYNNWYWVRYLMQEQEIHYLEIYKIGWKEFRKVKEINDI